MKNSLYKVLTLGLLLMLTIPGIAQDAGSKSQPGDDIRGTWVKMRKNPNMQRSEIEIDLSKKTVMFGYRGFGTLFLDVVEVKKDTKVGFARYTVSIKGNFGKMKLTILAFSSNKIYIGHAPKKGIKIWGTYTRKKIVE